MQARYLTRDIFIGSYDRIVDGKEMMKMDDGIFVTALKVIGVICLIALAVLLSPFILAIGGLIASIAEALLPIVVLVAIILLVKTIVFD